MIYTRHDARPALVLIREDRARLFCAGLLPYDAPAGQPSLYVSENPDSLCLYVGNVMCKRHILDALIEYCAKYQHVKVIFFSTHSKGIRNLAIHCGFKITFVPSDDSMDGAICLGDRPAINRLVSKCAPLVERIAKRKIQQCQNSENLQSSLSSGCSRPSRECLSIRLLAVIADSKAG